MANEFLTDPSADFRIILSGDLAPFHSVSIKRKRIPKECLFHTLISGDDSASEMIVPEKNSKHFDLIFRILFPRGWLWCNSYSGLGKEIAGMSHDQLTSLIKDMCYFGVDKEWICFAQRYKVIQSFGSLQFQALLKRFRYHNDLFRDHAQMYCEPGSEGIPDHRINFWLRNFIEYFSHFGKNHGCAVNPTREIMFVWYCYTLHPLDYRKDCMDAFGWIPELPFGSPRSSGSFKYRTKLTEQEKIKPSVDLKIDIKKRIEKSLETFQVQENITAEDTLARYLAFLTIIKRDRQRGEKLVRVPSKDIDLMWHAHLAAPNEYNAFCLKVFGEFLNHTPGYDKHMHEEAKLTEVEFNKILPHEDYIVDIPFPASYEEYFYDDGCG